MPIEGAIMSRRGRVRFGKEARDLKEAFDQYGNVTAGVCRITTLPGKPGEVELVLLVRQMPYALAQRIRRRAAIYVREVKSRTKTLESS